MAAGADRGANNSARDGANEKGIAMGVFQMDAPTRNAGLDAYETHIGASPILEIRSGAIPANCAAATTGTLLASMVLPANWMADAAAGVKALAGLWQDLLGNADGDAGYFRIFESTGVTCKMQGDVGEAGSGAVMILDNEDIGLGAPVTIVSFALTAGNA